MPDFTTHPFILYVLIPIAVGVIVGLFLRLFGIGKGDKNINQTHHGSGDNVGGDKITQEIKKFSEVQTIQVSSQRGNYNEGLNLDNIAQMLHVDSSNLDSIDMLLLESAPLGVENPERDVEYKIDTNHVVIFPANNLNSTINNAEFIPKGSKKFTFDRFNNKTQNVEIGGKKFIVTLQNILDKSSKEEKLIEYRFGIREE